MQCGSKPLVGLSGLMQTDQRAQRHTLNFKPYCVKGQGGTKDPSCSQAAQISDPRLLIAGFNAMHVSTFIIVKSHLTSHQPTWHQHRPFSPLQVRLCLHIWCAL
jgi:hypothetical protein